MTGDEPLVPASVTCWYLVPEVKAMSQPVVVPPIAEMSGSTRCA